MKPLPPATITDIAINIDHIEVIQSLEGLSGPYHGRTLIRGGGKNFDIFESFAEVMAKIEDTLDADERIVVLKGFQ